MKERALLEEDLPRMGCHGLIKRLWCLRYEKIVAELLINQDNRWHGIVRQDSDKWTASAWRKVYSFPIRGKGMAIRREKFVEGKISHPPHPKVEYNLPNCKDPRARRVLEFLNPISTSRNL